MNAQLIFTFLLSLVCTSLPGQVDASAYLPRPFGQILLERKTCADPASDLNVCTEIHKYQTQLTYLGEMRPITGQKAELLKSLQISWKALPNVVKFFATYHQEILVTSKGIKEWIPIQDSLIPEVKQYLKPNHDFLAFLVVPGAIRSELVFVLTRFDELD
ncbi:hypothetical protein [Geothrix alkalitolerans]|uniref:hypothetical protein n=1 Tax=Geothrix alkalitolerans TaxID=2922724 RepID=UPI001FAF7707|nr:hypothetical protein [Geothrix alkalitolerans]